MHTKAVFLVKKIVHYFDLRTRSLNLRGSLDSHDKSEQGRSSTNSTLNLFSYHLLAYGSVALGVLGRGVFNERSEHPSEYLSKLAVALVIAAVIYPMTAHSAEINPENVHPLHFFVAFQNGFFWETILSEISK